MGRVFCSVVIDQLLIALHGSFCIILKRILACFEMMQQLPCKAINNRKKQAKNPDNGGRKRKGKDAGKVNDGGWLVCC